MSQPQTHFDFCLGEWESREHSQLAHIDALPRKSKIDSRKLLKNNINRHHFVQDKCVHCVNALNRTNNSTNDDSKYLYQCNSHYNHCYQSNVEWFSSWSDQWHSSNRQGKIDILSQFVRWMPYSSNSRSLITK